MNGVIRPWWHTGYMRQQQFYQPSQFALPLYFYTVHKHITDVESHVFSFFFFKLLTVWSSHILPEWRDNKKIGGEVD